MIASSSDRSDFREFSARPGPDIGLAVQVDEKRAAATSKHFLLKAMQSDFVDCKFSRAAAFVDCDGLALRRPD